MAGQSGKQLRKVLDGQHGGGKSIAYWLDKQASRGYRWYEKETRRKAQICIDRHTKELVIFGSNL